jgi:hypothetical protein
MFNRYEDVHILQKMQLRNFYVENAVTFIQFFGDDWKKEIDFFTVCIINFLFLLQYLLYIAGITGFGSKLCTVLWPSDPDPQIWIFSKK